jgi:ABC-type multidrug transport system fused ATPase/permease subunit
MHLATEIVAATPALERILRYVPDRSATAKVIGRARAVEAAVEVDAVSYRYPEQPPEHAVLTEVGLRVGAGELVAVVGASGSGKTTLALLIAGMLRPTSGTVSTDGRVALVAQRPHLVNASVRDNIAYGNPEATAVDVMAAAAVAGLHDRILAMAEGYDTEIGQQGAALSGGEGQRLSLARAVLADARVMVFDEATSGLDAVTERQVWANLRAGPTTRTMIVISHNLDIARRADRVYVLGHGRVIASGSDEELRKGCAAYRALHEDQDLSRR